MMPLEGVRVVELCQFAAGPFGGMLLADMGADVVKVEPPGGDDLRHWPPQTGGFSDNFCSLNRNKRSVVLDLKDPAGVEAARALIHTADVVLENYRPGVLERLGLSYESFASNPSLVYCSISAFGQSGPRSQEGGFDLTMQALSGIMSVTGEPEGGPVKCGVPISDFGTALYAAFAIVSALRKAERTGVGEHIDVSMLGASLGMAALQTSEYFGTHRDPAKLGSAHPRSAPYQAFRTDDGYLAIAAGNDRLWHAVTRVVGREELLADARFQTNTLRAKHQRELAALIEEVLAKASTTTWLERFTKAGVPCAPINSYSEALDDPQVEHMQWLQPMELPDGTRIRTFGSPMKMTHQQFGIRRRVPMLGEHTEEVLTELGPRQTNLKAIRSPQMRKEEKA
jgi:crotonobetainyl-CoA:carnitine CoA-transferase CaiB-like acyl-CoA transferase